MLDEETFSKIQQKFSLLPRYKFENYGDGHLNHTYRLVGSGEEAEEYVLQLVNTDIFSIPEVLESNFSSFFELYSEHFHSENLVTVRKSINNKIHEPIRINSKLTYARLFKFIKNSKAIGNIGDVTSIYELSKFIGSYTLGLSRFPVERFKESIKGFNNPAKRFRNLEQAVLKDPCKRLYEIKDFSQELLSLEEEATKWWKAYSTGLVPKRVLHHDLKYGNILLDKGTRQPIAIVDLDTVMPGALSYDFGDFTRQFASTALEDDISFDVSKFCETRFLDSVKGFIAGFGVANITKDEKSLFPIAPWSSTVVLAMRFLTDYLQGDKYFAVSHPKQNLNRAQQLYFVAKWIYDRKAKIQDVL